MQEYLKDFQMVFVNMLADDGKLNCPWTAEYVCLSLCVSVESTICKGWFNLLSLSLTVSPSYPYCSLVFHILTLPPSQL